MSQQEASTKTRKAAYAAAIADLEPADKFQARLAGTDDISVRVEMLCAQVTAVNDANARLDEADRLAARVVSSTGAGTSGAPAEEAIHAVDEATRLLRSPTEWTSGPAPLWWRPRKQRVRALRPEPGATGLARAAPVPTPAIVTGWYERPPPNSSDLAFQTVSAP